MNSFFAVLLLWSLYPAGQELAESDLQTIVLVQNDERYELGVDGNCRLNDRVGVVSSDQFHELWDKLVSEIEVTSLDSEVIKNQVLEQIKITRTVGSVDPATLTSLKLEYSNSSRKIEIHNLAALNNTYPNAVDLARLYSAMLVLKRLSSVCIRGTNKASQE